MTEPEHPIRVTFPDYFSGVASKYAQYRPRYPAELAAVLAAETGRRDDAWDIGCGNGQLSTVLADYFAHVIATDPSRDQLARAIPHPRVEYRCATAEDSGLADASVDLSVAAQSAHWFDWPRFVVEVGRVTRPGGLVALVAYEGMLVDDEPDPAIRRYKQTVEAYWPVQRSHIDNGYRDLVLPWPAVEAPPLELAATWTREELAGYVSSWSATNAYIKQHGTAAFDALCADLADTWAEGERRRVHWPLLVKLARR